MSLLSPSLEAFWAVVQKGTVQDASSILGITQTGVTQRIRSLEKQLKTTLFTRSRKGMKLTSEGEALLQYVKNSLELEGMALSKIQRASLESIIEIGITGSSSILRSRVIPHLSSLKKKYPLLRFRFDLSDSDTSHVNNSVDKLKSGLCDFAILEHHQVTREMDSKVLKPEKYSLYGSVLWKKRNLSEIIETEPIIDFNQQDQMTFLFLEKYKLKSKAVKERHFVNNTDGLVSMVNLQMGYTVLSEEFAETYLKKNSICHLTPGMYLDHKVALAWYPRTEKPEYFQAIIKSIN